MNSVGGRVSFLYGRALVYTQKYMDRINWSPWVIKLKKEKRGQEVESREVRMDLGRVKE